MFVCYFSMNILLIGEEAGRLQMYAYGVVHIGTIEFAQLGIHNVGFFFVLLSFSPISTT